MSTIERKLQLTVNRIVRWADLCGFKFSLSKTVAVHFCRIHRHHPDPDIYIKGQRIPCLEETKFLGLVFDHRLTWAAHLKYTKSVCLKAMSILKVLSHTSWGADRKTLIRLYKALILSKLLYGCELYSSATQRQLKTLDSIHHGGIRLATGGFKSSPISNLLVDAEEMPLELHRQSSMVKYWYRLQRLPSSLAYTSTSSESHFSYFETHPKSPQPYGFRVRQLLSNSDLPLEKVFAFKSSAIPPWNLPEIDFCNYFICFKKDLTEVETRSIFMEHIAEHYGSNFIFTDGSKSCAGAGFGVYNSQFYCKGALPSVASVFTAELYAILKALEKIFSFGNENYTIFSDSKSALQCLSTYNPTNPLVLEILQLLYKIETREITVKFCWVPAHVGVHGNEAADKLAKQAATDLLPWRCPLLCSDFYPHVNTWVNSKWQDIWNLEIANKLKEITSVISPWKYGNMPRKWEVVLCRLRIGHTRLTHKYLMEDGHQPYCDDCLVPLTVRHLLVECPSLGDLRRQYLSEGLGGDGNYILAKILGEDVVYGASGIFNFIVEAGLLNEL